MTKCSKEIRSFILGVIAWGILTLFIKWRNDMTEAFGQLVIKNDKLNLFEGNPLPGFDASGYWIDDNTGSDLSGFPGSIGSKPDISGVESIYDTLNEYVTNSINQIKEAVALYKDLRENLVKELLDNMNNLGGVDSDAITLYKSYLERFGIKIRTSIKHLKERQKQIRGFAIKLADNASKEFGKIQELEGKITPTPQPFDGFMI